jgi:GNAT superfamily N-acetyltransferase
MTPPHSDVIFRNLGDNVPPDCQQHCNWQVECHEGRGFPSGLAWVLVPPDGPGQNTETKQGGSLRPLVKFVLVTDDARRRGIGSRLIEACRERWPDLVLSAPISEAGLGLYRKLQPPVPEDVFNAAFIEQFLAAGGTRELLEQLARKHFQEGVTEQDDRPVDVG